MPAERRESPFTTYRINLSVCGLSAIDRWTLIKIREIQNEGRKKRRYTSTEKNQQSTTNSQQSPSLSRDKAQQSRVKGQQSLFSGQQSRVNGQQSLFSGQQSFFSMFNFNL